MIFSRLLILALVSLTAVSAFSLAYAHEITILQAAGGAGVTVQSVDQNNHPIYGFLTLLCTQGTSQYQDGHTSCENQGPSYMASGYTTVTFNSGMMVGQTYGVQAMDGVSCSFSHWSDNPANINRFHLFTATTPPQTLTAVYNCLSTSSTTSSTSTSTSPSTTITSTSSTSSQTTATSTTTSSSTSTSSTTSSSSSTTSQPSMASQSTSSTAGNSSSSIGIQSPLVTISSVSVANIVTPATTNAAMTTAVQIEPLSVPLPIIGALGALIIVAVGVIILWARRL